MKKTASIREVFKLWEKSVGKSVTGSPRSDSGVPVEIITTLFNFKMAKEWGWHI